MPVVVACPNPVCAKSLTVRSEYLGKTVKCKRCQHEFVLQQPATETVMGGGSTHDAVKPAPPPPADSALPTTIGRFRVLAEIGAGAFGTVYRAHDPHLDREVALKVPRAGVLDSPTAVERFLREAKAAAQLRHPAIVPVFEAGPLDRGHYIASAYVPGQPLSAAIPDAGLEFRRAAQIVRALAEAAAYAHEQGIVHRDIKPQNVILDDKDRPHLLDFGLAARRDGSEKLTSDGAVLGTPAYMAPEQAAGSQGEAEPAADQYSLGVVLYELLTGRAPFAGPPAVVVFNVLNTEPPAPSTVRPDVPQSLETICLTAMAKREEGRYADCRALADALGQWLDAGEFSVVAVSIAAYRRPRSKWPTNAFLVLIAAIGVMALLTTVVNINRAGSGSVGQLSTSPTLLASTDQRRQQSDILKGDTQLDRLEIAKSTYQNGMTALRRDVMNTLSQCEKQASGKK